MLGDRVVVARYWGHVFGGEVLRVDGIGGQGSGGTVLGTRFWRAKY